MQRWSCVIKSNKEVISFLIVLKFALDEMRCHSSISLPDLCRQFNFFFLFHSCDLRCHSADLIRMRIWGSRERDGASLGNRLTDKDWVDVLHWKTTGWFTNSKTQIGGNTHWTHTCRLDAHTVSHTVFQNFQYLSGGYPGPREINRYVTFYYSQKQTACPST